MISPYLLFVKTVVSFDSALGCLFVGSGPYEKLGQLDIRMAICYAVSLVGAIGLSRAISIDGDT